MKKIGKKISEKFLKLLMLISMIFSSFQTPIYVLADELTSEETTPQYEKGDMRLGETGTITKDGTVTVQAGSTDLNTDGNVQVTKTVTEVEDGKYKVDFLVKGKDVQNIITTTKPIYFVIVVDTSGSMICDSTQGGYAIEVESDEHYTAADGGKIQCVRQNGSGNMSQTLTQTKWENAVTGAVNFATQLTTMANTYVSLVTFASSANDATEFTRTPYTASDFGHPVGGTNLKEGIQKAQAKLDTITDTNAQKYILVIGDGEPSYGGYSTGQGPNRVQYTATEAAYQEATKAKNAGTKIYAIGYGITEGSTAENVLKYVSSNTTVTSTNPTGKEEGTYVDNGYYKTTGTDGISSTLNTIFTSVGEASKAGTSATLTDGIGGQFKIVTESDEEVSGYGVSYVNSGITEITEEGTTISFYIQINEDAPTGWYDTNANFNLTYTDANGETQTITCTQNPQVYWVQNTYDYVVNYYKDSIETGELLATETRQAPAGTVINQDNVEKDKYLTNAGEGYEFNSVSPTSITIENNGEAKTINVLYTIKKYSYNVNYYYDGVLDTELSHTVSNVNHGTTVESESYYLTASEIKEGYKLDSTNTTKGNIVINSNGLSINIYYIKDNFDFTVNYYFNGTLNNVLTKNETAVYEEVIKAEDHYLTEEELKENNYSDYFLHPTTPANPTQIQIGTNPENNILNIYYINTFVNQENIDKTTTTDKVISSQDVVKYSVNYKATVKNVKANETITITIVDTLPYEIDLTKSNLNNGIYDSTNKTITWTIVKNVTTFTDSYEIDETINYEVVYKDFSNISAEEYNKLKNNVIGKTTVANKTTQGVEDNTETTVEIYGNLTVKYVDESNNDLLTPETSSEKVGTAYETSSKTIYGYTLKETPTNKKGTYTEEDITVIYVYTKNEGSTEINEVSKEGPTNISSVDGQFNYTLTYTGKITEYVGEATLTLKDYLPYELDLEKSTFEGCTYDNKVLTCTKTYTIDEENQDVIAEFNLSLVFKNVDSETVTNKVESTLDYGKDTPDTDTDETETEVYKGTVIAKYEDENGTTLEKSETTTGLAETTYETSEKTIYGYTLKETPTNKTGKYKANETIEVIYVYTKNEGTTKENKVEKAQINKILGATSTFKYVLTYNGEIENYVGQATVTLKDTLPFEVESIEYNQELCTYDATSRTLTCTKTEEITEEDTTISVSFEVIVTYKNLTSELNLEVKNIVESTLIYGNTEEPGNAEVTDTVLSGKVIANYEDEAGNALADSVTTTGLIDTEYKTSAKTIYGYTLKETPTNEEGKYTKEDITVTYVYTKNEGSTETNEVVKEGPTNVSSVDGTFNYTLTYTGKIIDYVGEATLTLKDYLPYELDLEKSTFEGCTYENKVLTCTKIYTIDETNQDVTAEFNLSLVFKNVDSETVTNKVESTLDYGKDTPDTDTDETETKVLKGTVIAKYEDESGNTLSDSITTTGLVDTEYETSEKTIYGYTLKEIPTNKEGKYTEETITVTYVYTKNEGSTKTNEVVKTQINPILGTTSTFKYVLTYNGEIENYVGQATVTLEDTLPFEVLEITYDTNSCKYNETSRTLTCTKTEEITEADTTINASFEIIVTYKNLNSMVDLEITNVVKSTLDYGKNTPDTDTDEVTNTVKSGTVIAKYEDESGNTLSDSITTTGLIDTEYETSEKTIYGYTLKTVDGSETGKYTEETITVTYVYTKNEGTTEINEVVKEGPENITSTTGTFNYTLTYTGKIIDYVGEATLTLKDYLPYELDLEKSTFEGCIYENKVLTCTKTYTIDEDNQDVTAEFNLSLVFKNVDSETVTNKVESTLDYGKDTPDTDTDETETEVYKGKVIATYKNIEGETLTEDITQEGLAGTNYETEELEFLGYTLKEVPTNQDGVYVANDTIYVNYIYEKNVGTSKEDLEKQGDLKVTNITDPFKYKITYDLEILDYVGDVKITLTDYLPYELDLEKSILGDVCKYVDGTLECVYIHTINTEEDSKINIEENLVLYYKNITSNEVTNRIEAKVVYGDKEKIDEDEFTTEIPYGTVKVNYVTDKGETLSQTIITTDLVGASYTTEQKAFDNYYLKEVVGEKDGLYTEEEIEVTYVYSKIPLPPQTGVENNFTNYIGLFIFAVVVLILKRRYL